MEKNVFSFDGTTTIKSAIHRPEKYDTLFNILAKGNFIPRGAGLSYCLASADEKCASIDSKIFDRVLSFDKIKGLITVEAGMNMGELLQIVMAASFTFPVLPGYPKITVGGCIAFNIHGKSQYNIGLFSKYINRLKLFHPAHGEIECSQINNADIFHLTIGGFGLTGFITEVELILLPLGGKNILRSKVMVKNLSAAIAEMSQKKDAFMSAYSWNNLNLTKNKFGKGIVYFEKYCSEESTQTKVKPYNNLTSDGRRKLLFSFLNKFTINLECYAYNYLEALGKSQTISKVENALFPINGKEIYFKLFGKQGLREYQLIIPFEHWGNFEDELKQLINKLGIAICLGSLKLFDGNQKFLSFNKTGICMAIDVPATNASLLFFDKLDELVLRNEGIANISKDSRLSKEVIQKMYPEYDSFKMQIINFEKTFPLYSTLRRRIF